MWCSRCYKKRRWGEADPAGQPWRFDQADPCSRRGGGEGVEELDPHSVGIQRPVPDAPQEAGHRWTNFGYHGLLHQEETFIRRISGIISYNLEFLAPTQVKLMGIKIVMFTSADISFLAGGHKTRNKGILQSFRRTSLLPLQIWQVRSFSSVKRKKEE